MSARGGGAPLRAPRAVWAAAVVLTWVLFTAAWVRAAAEEGDAGPDAGSRTSEALDGAATDEASVAAAALELRCTADEIAALTAGRLDRAVGVDGLFDVSLDDDDAIRVEAERLRLLLREVDRTPRPSGPSRRPAKDAGAAEAGLDVAVWDARLAVDRARLAFYDLPAERRRTLVAEHDRQADAESPVSRAELREREAEAQRQAALLAAKNAHSEAERLVSNELARLLTVERAQALLDQDLERQRKETADNRDATLGWRQRALEALSQPGPPADTFYDDLRRALRSAREALSVALDELGRASHDVPDAGSDPLADLPTDVDTSAARSERERVDTNAKRLRSDLQAAQRARAAQLFEEIDTLNRARLALLGSLSPDKREAITGFTASGWDQATSEARQLTLILRYHRHVVGEWLLALRDPKGALGGRMLAGGAFRLVEWVLAFGVLLWARRRAAPLLEHLETRAVEVDRQMRLTKPSATTRLLAFFGDVQGSLGWLGLLFLLKWLLPAEVQGLLEVRVLIELMTWVFGAGFVVDAINALAGNTKALDAGGHNTAALRLSSLRFIARVVVAFGLVLALCAMLVGRGTIYEWVFVTSWIAALPVLIVLVRRWRVTIFLRTARVRKPGSIQRWVLANREGFWTSFAAAAVGGSYLFASSTLRGLRSWIGRFVITRRALAYLFRRQLGKREPVGAVEPLADEAFRALGPESMSAEWIPSASEETVSRILARIQAHAGGVLAVVGERGMGKSSVFGRLAADAPEVLVLEAPPDLETLRARLAGATHLSPAASLEEHVAAIAASATVRAVLLDDAHRFVRPMMGGLAAFDALVESVSRHATGATWVLALDHVIWQFLERARGARPLFDEVLRLEPWSEEQIAALLQSRTKAAGLAPSFEGLLDPLPATADEIDRQEALAQRAADYHRLLWDAARGNPGVALHMWRRSLGRDPSGGIVVRAGSILDTSDLERLPDPSVFVLRAVLQLAPARVEQISQCTLIRKTDVVDALRYATSRGYVESNDGLYRVTWTWFRAITLFLQRRHLLVLG